MGSPGAAGEGWVGHPGKAEARAGDGEGGGRCRLPLGPSAGALSWGPSAWLTVLAVCTSISEAWAGCRPARDAISPSFRPGRERISNSSCRLIRLELSLKPGPRIPSEAPGRQCMEHPFMAKRWLLLWLSISVLDGSPVLCEEQFYV